MNKPGLLLVGNFLSSHMGTRGVGEELSMRLSSNGWKTIETSHQPGRIVRLIDMLGSVLAHRKSYLAAYVEVYSGLAFFWAEMVVLLLSLLHKPVLLALHGGGLVEFSQRNPRRVRRLLSKGRIVVTPSLYLQQGLQPLRADIHYLPNALEISRYKYQARNAPEPRLIWLRAFHRIYQPELAVRTAACLSGYFAQTTLTMIGPDKKDGSLASTMEVAESLGIASHVEIPGFIPKSEVPAWLEKGDIFLNTTKFESFGISVMEAAASGLPIVTTSAGELSYLWKDGENAMLVHSEDPKQMAAAIRRILTDPDLATRLAANARSKAEGYDWSVILPKWETLFADLISHA